jgi:RNA polymerase sigma-70 factor (ECF subfamily)
VSERELIARALSGDEEAWATIVESHEAAVWVLSWALIRDTEAARDVAQDTFRVVWERLGQFRGPCSLLHWIRAICRNRARDELRRRHRRPEVSMDGPQWTEAKEGGVWRSTAHSDDERWCEHLDLEWALRQVGEEEREAFLLVKAAGYTSEAAAQLLEVAPTTVRSRVGRLAQLLIEYERQRGDPGDGDG